VSAVDPTYTAVARSVREIASTSGQFGVVRMLGERSLGAGPEVEFLSVHENLGVRERAGVARVVVMQVG
jgi:hypothetical protein